MSDHPEGFYMDEPIGVNTQLKKIAKLKVALKERDATIEALRAQVEKYKTAMQNAIDREDGMCVAIESLQAALEESGAIIEELRAQVDICRNGIKQCFPHLVVCDGVLMVKVDDYNKMVSAINTFKNPELLESEK